MSLFALFLSASGSGFSVLHEALPLHEAISQLGRMQAEQVAHLNISEDGQVWSLGAGGLKAGDEEESADPYLARTSVLLSLPRSLLETDASLNNGTLEYFLQSAAIYNSLKEYVRNQPGGIRQEQNTAHVPQAFARALFYLYHYHSDPNGRDSGASRLWHAWAHHHAEARTAKNALFRWSDAELAAQGGG